MVWPQAAPTHRREWLQDALAEGATQTMRVLVTAHDEPARAVRECVLRLLVAPEPVYMEKVLYVCDDSSDSPEGLQKAAMVEHLRAIGPSFSGCYHAGSIASHRLLAGGAGLPGPLEQPFTVKRALGCDVLTARKWLN